MLVIQEKLCLQPAGEGNAATALFRVNLTTSDDVAASERIQVQAKGPELGILKSKVSPTPTPTPSVGRGEVWMTALA